MEAYIGIWSHTSTYCKHCYKWKNIMLDEFYMYLIEVLSTTFDKICKDINDKLQNAKYGILNSVYIEYNSKPLISII